MITDNFKKRIITSTALIILLFFVILSKIALLYSLIIIGIYSILEFLNLSQNIFKKFISRVIANILFTIFIFIYFTIFFYFSNFIQLKIILFALLFGCIASDIGGYIFGKIIKGPKISKISPNKTLAGSFGSLILCSTTFTVSILFFTNTSSLLIMTTGLVTSVFCQLGDLFFSYLKRKAKKKDTGNILPGHGGILDRIDGILLGIPSGYLFLLIFLR
jgi:phosphatidate cytidylyltransferase